MKTLKSALFVSLFTFLGTAAQANEVIALDCQTHTGGFCSGSGGCFSDESHLKLILSDLNGTAAMDLEDFVVHAEQNADGSISFAGKNVSQFAFVDAISGTVHKKNGRAEVELNYVYRGVKNQNSYICR